MEQRNLSCATVQHLARLGDDPPRRLIMLCEGIVIGSRRASLADDDVGVWPIVVHTSRVAVPWNNDSSFFLFHDSLSVLAFCLPLLCIYLIMLILAHMHLLQLKLFPLFLTGRSSSLGNKKWWFSPSRK